MSNESRRKLLKTIAAGSGAVIAGKSLPDKWAKPVVNTVMLPSHAQTSVCVIAGTYCDINGLIIVVLADGTVSVDFGGFTGTGPVDPNAGGSFDILTDRVTAVLRVAGTVVCNSTAISGTITGVGAYTATQTGCIPSDRAIKTNFAPVDEQEILRKVASMPIETWNYTDREAGVRHIGPMAQDFMASFNVGDSDRHIHMVDANGVNLAAIKALNSKLEEKDSQILALQEQLDKVMKVLEKIT